MRLSWCCRDPLSPPGGCHNLERLHAALCPRLREQWTVVAERGLPSAGKDLSALTPALSCLYGSLRLTRAACNTREKTLTLCVRPYLRGKKALSACLPWFFMFSSGCVSRITKHLEKDQTVHFWLGPALVLSYSLGKHCGYIIAANVGGKDQELGSFPQET